MFIKTFDNDDDYYSGYFSNKKLTDIDDDYIASIITVKDLRKVSTQMKVSMGSFMDMVKYFGVIMFILLMYLLSKQIIEKNSNSIALTKILGYSDMEIGGLYIITTFVVVVISLLLAIPIVNIFLHEMFTSYLYTQMTVCSVYHIKQLLCEDVYYGCTQLSCGLCYSNGKNKKDTKERCA